MSSRICRSAHIPVESVCAAVEAKRTPGFEEIDEPMMMLVSWARGSITPTAFPLALQTVSREIPASRAVLIGDCTSALRSQIASVPIFGGRPRQAPLRLAATIPSACRSRRRLVSTSAKGARHVEKRLAGSGRGIHGLSGRGDVGAPLPELRDNDLEILHRACQTFDARDCQSLARMDEVKEGPEFGPGLEGGAAAGLGPDHGAARGIERRDLGHRNPVRGRDPGMTDSGRRSVRYVPESCLVAPSPSDDFANPCLASA